MTPSSRDRLIRGSSTFTTGDSCHLHCKQWDREGWRALAELAESLLRAMQRVVQSSLRASQALSSEAAKIIFPFHDGGGFAVVKGASLSNHIIRSPQIAGRRIALAW